MTYKFLTNPSGDGYVHLTTDGGMEFGTFSSLASTLAPLLSGGGSLTLTGDVTGPSNSNTVIKIRNNPVVSQTLSSLTDGYVLTWDNGDGYWKAEPISVSSSGVSPGTAGQIFVTNSSPTSIWTSLINYETVHGRFTAGGSGSDHFATIGPAVSAETTYSALYLLNNGAVPGSTNFALQSDGTSNLTVNSPSANGSIYFELGGSVYMSMIHSSSTGLLALGNVVPSTTNYAIKSDGGSTTAVNVATGGGIISFRGSDTTYASIETTHGNITAGGSGSDASTIIGTRVSGATLPTIYLLSNGVSANTGNWALQGDSSGHLYHNTVSGTGTHFFLAGGTTIATIEGVHGKGTFGGSGSDFQVVNGPAVGSETANAAIWLLPNGVSPTANNYFVEGDGTSVFFSTRGAGGIFQWYQANSNFLAQLDGTNFKFGAQGPANILWDKGIASPTIYQSAQTTDVATNSLTIKGQYAFGTASPSNRTPGNLIFDIGSPTNSGTTEAFFKFTRSTTEMARIQLLNGFAQAALWLGTGAAFVSDTSNAAVISDATSATYLNTGGSGAVGFLAAAARFLLYIPTSQDHLYFLGTNAAAPWSIDASTSTTPKMQSGTSATSLTVGTNKSAASLILQAGSTTTIATFTDTTSSIGVSTGTNTLIGALVQTTRTSSSNFTIDTTTTDNLIRVTATQTVTLPAPTTGRTLEIWVDATGGTDVTLTLAQHSSEKINNIAASWIVTASADPTGSTGQIAKLCVRSFNGTDWFVAS